MATAKTRSPVSKTAAPARTSKPRTVKSKAAQPKETQPKAAVATMSAETAKTMEAVAQKAAAPSKDVEKDLVSAQRTAEKAVNTAAETTVQKTEAVSDMAADTVRKVQTLAVKSLDPKSIEELAAYGRKNVEAVAMAGTILTKGFETMAAAWLEFAKESMDQTVGTARSVMGAKTLREAVDLQSDFAKTSVNDLIAESTRFTEMGAKVAQEALSPIKDRVEDTAQRLGLPRAA
ncbi:MAG: phasin family protein [Inquilinaceae bacterium]